MRNYLLDCVGRLLSAFLCCVDRRLGAFFGFGASRFHRAGALVDNLLSSLNRLFTDAFGLVDYIFAGVFRLVVCVGAFVFDPASGICNGFTGSVESLLGRTQLSFFATRRIGFGSRLAV